VSVQGQWLGDWPGDWQGAGESAAPGSISGVATLRLSVAGAVSDANAGVDNGVQRPLGRIHVVAPPRRQPDPEAVPGWISGVAQMRLSVTGRLSINEKRLKSRRLQVAELLELV